VTHDQEPPITPAPDASSPIAKLDNLRELVRRIPIDVSQTAIILIARDENGDIHMASLLDAEATRAIAHQIVDQSIAKQAFDLAVRSMAAQQNQPR
jgi:hypothetical protein